MPREWITLECTVCGRRNYRTQKGSNRTKRLGLKKYCRFDRKHTLHRERKK